MSDDIPDIATAPILGEASQESDREPDQGRKVKAKAAKKKRSKSKAKKAAKTAAKAASEATAAIEARIGHSFADPGLLTAAITRELSASGIPRRSRARPDRVRHALSRLSECR
jgi:ribonuclease III